MSGEVPGVNMGEASLFLKETLAELTGAADISDRLDSDSPISDDDDSEVSANIQAMFGKSPMSTSKFLEFIPVPDELAMYSHPIKFSKAIQTTTLDKLKLNDILTDLAIWRFEISSRWVPPLSEGYDGFRFKSDYAIRKRYARGIEQQWGFLETFNDVLSFRVRVPEYPEVLPKYFKVVDYVHSKPIIDKGYKAMHLYFQMSPIHYPIEIQLWGTRDWEFNSWGQTKGLFLKDPDLGRKLRLLYDMGKINSLVQFEKYMAQMEREGA